MEVNLTGQIAQDLANNLKPTIWSSAISFGVITAIITSGITYLTVRKTINATEEREERNRIHELRMVQRRERKNAYINFISFIYRTDAFCNLAVIEKSGKSYIEAYSQYERSIIELTLHNPKLVKNINAILKKNGNPNPIEFIKKWENLSKDFKKDIVPLMQAEMHMDEGVRII